MGLPRARSESSEILRFLHDSGPQPADAEVIRAVWNDAGRSHADLDLSTIIGICAAVVDRLEALAGSPPPAGWSPPPVPASIGWAALSGADQQLLTRVRQGVVVDGARRAAFRGRDRTRSHLGARRRHPAAGRRRRPAPAARWPAGYGLIPWVRRAGRRDSAGRAPASRAQTSNCGAVPHGSGRIPAQPWPRTCGAAAASLSPLRSRNGQTTPRATVSSAPRAPPMLPRLLRSWA